MRGRCLNTFVLSHISYIRSIYFIHSKCFKDKSEQVSLRLAFNHQDGEDEESPAKANGSEEPEVISDSKDDDFIIPEGIKGYFKKIAILFFNMFYWVGHAFLGPNPKVGGL